MFAQSAFYTEFLSESNLVLTQGDFGNRASDLFAPIKNYLQNKEKDVLSFSLARYSGASSRLAFFCEWYYQAQKLSSDSSELIEETREYLSKKIPLSLRGVPNLQDIIKADIESFYLPQQLAFLQSRSKEMEQGLVEKFPFLSKYLNHSFFGKISASEILSRQYLYSDKISLSQFLEAQGTRLSFVSIGLPCLLGFLHNFHREESPISPKGVKWVIVEEILKSIAFLHQTGLSQDIALFIYKSGLDDKQRFHWLQLSRSEKILEMAKDEKIISQVKEIRRKVRDKAKVELKTLVFPEKYREMFGDLIDWTFALGRG